MALNKQTELRRLMKLQKKRNNEKQNQQQTQQTPSTTTISTQTISTQIAAKSILKKARIGSSDGTRRNIQEPLRIAALANYYGDSSCSSNDEEETTHIPLKKVSNTLTLTKPVKSPTTTVPKPKQQLFNATIAAQILQREEQIHKDCSNNHTSNSSQDQETAWNAFQASVDQTPTTQASTTTTTYENKNDMNNHPHQPTQQDFEQASYEARIAKLKSARHKPNGTVLVTHANTTTNTTKQSLQNDPIPSPLELLRKKIAKQRKLAATIDDEKSD